MQFHQIWIGRKQPPLRWMRTVTAFCETYGHAYTLWGNDEVASIDLERYPGLAELYGEYESREGRYKRAGQADILRTVIVYEHGGVYLDADMVVVNGRPFDAFLSRMGNRVFYGWETTDKLVANSVIGAPAGHPFIAECLEEMPRFAEANRVRPVWHRTGPFFVTHMIKRPPPRYGAEIHIAPKHHFYPDGWHGIRDANEHEKRVFGPDTMLFQYGYTTNNLGDNGAVSRGFRAIGKPIVRLGRWIRRHVARDAASRRAA